MAKARILGWFWQPDVQYPRKNADGVATITPSGSPVHKCLADIFSDETIQDAVLSIKSARSLLQRARASWNPFVPPSVIDDLERAEAMLAGAVPWGLCSDCEGKIDTADGCGLCMGQGWVPVAGNKARESER